MTCSVELSTTSKVRATWQHRPLRHTRSEGASDSYLSAHVATAISPTTLTVRPRQLRESCELSSMACFCGMQHLIPVQRLLRFRCRHSLYNVRIQHPSIRSTQTIAHSFAKHFFTDRCPRRHRCPWSVAFFAKLSGDPAALPPKYFLNCHTKSNHIDASILNRVRIG